MRPLSLWSVRIALVVSLAAAVALSFLPLVGAPGPESALALGVLLPPFVAAAGARMAIDARSMFGAPSGTVVVRVAWRAIAMGVFVVLVASIVLLVHAYIAHACDPLPGLAYLAMGPGFGAALAAVTGMALGALVPRPRLSTWLAILVPFAADGLALWRFYATPSVDSFGQLFGWFPGTIYDEGVDIRPAYIALRIATTALVLGTVALLTALGAVALRAPGPPPAPTLGRARRGTLATLGRRAVGAPLATTTALLLFAFAAAIEVRGEDLGLRGSSAHAAKVLGGRVRGLRCDVVVPRELAPAEARLLADDCSFRVVAAERALGVRHRRRITAFFFRSVDEKRALMGAAETYIAKPWRDEVYLQLEPFPHPVLAHEIAHVVAGATGRGPFRIAGRYGGLWPDVAAIEGVAVAVAWDSRDGLSPDEWAQAMIATHHAPPLAHVLSGFFFESAQRAYTVAGSFYRFLLETKGAAVVRRAYASGDVVAATGERPSQLEREWREHLARVPLTPEALALARLRFARGGIFARACPHEVAALHGELAGDLAANDDARAVHTCREVLAIDPADPSTRALYVGALVRSGQRAAAERELAALRTRWAAPPPVLAAALESLADEAWRRGDRDGARTLYRELAAIPRSPDSRRIVEVKLLGVDAGGGAGELLRDLLAARTAPDGATAVHIARELGAVRDDGLAAYLEARQLEHAARWSDAVALLRDARARGLPTALVRVEARRMLGVDAYAAGDLATSESAWREALDGPEPATLGGDRADAQSFLDRIAWKRGYTPPSSTGGDH